MLEANTSSPTETIVTDTAPIESAAPSTPAQETTPAQADGSQTAQMPWQPDFKVKVKDQEIEIDEFLRPALTNEEQLKKAKRLYEQAHGLPEVSKARDEWKQKFESVQPKVQEYQQVQQNLDRLSYFVQNKDFDSFFEAIKVPTAEVYNWVKAKIEQQGLPPQVQQQLEQARVAQQKAYDYSRQLEDFQSQSQAQQQEQQYKVLNDSIAATAGDVAKQFNDRIGSQDAFQNAVINKGIAIQKATGQLAPVSEVIAMVSADLQRVMGIQPTQVQAQVPAAPQAAAPMQAGQKPVIPAMKAGSASPTAQSPRSIADLKKLGAAL